MVLKPFNEEGFFTHASFSLNDEGLVLLSGDVHIEPLLDH